jgi:hypothetical protein
VFDGPRGYGAEQIRVIDHGWRNGRRYDLATEDRSIPLVQPPTDEVRAAFAALGKGDKPLRAALIEH